MTPDGTWVFSAEGGSLAFVYIGGENPTSVPFPTSPALPQRPMRAAEKRNQVGSLGVLAADFALDPGLDLSDEPDTLPAGTEPMKYWPGAEDYKDILYIAGGHLGLWAMEAHPIAGYTNRAVRLDSGGSNGAPADIHRFCTDVEVVTINNQNFLLALFARRDNNLLRVYRLQDCRSALDAVRNSPPNTSDLLFEVPPIASFSIGRHPQQGPDVFVGAENVTLAASYAMDVAVDLAPDLSDGVGAGQATPPVDVYVAALSGGVVRLRLFAFGTPPAMIGFQTSGPVFGTDAVPPPGFLRAYDDVATTFNGVELNDSGIPAQWFKNHEGIVAARSARHGELIRSDPPYFMDVALQNDEGGHFLYCAMGHLGWLRFDLAAHHFENGMPIHHLEGRPALARDPSTGAPLGTSVEFSPGWRRSIELDRPDSSPFLEPFDLDDPAKPNALHAYQVALTRVGVGMDERTVLVVQYHTLPWTMEPRVKGPGRILDQTFEQIGTWGLEYIPLWRRETASCLAVYDDLGSLSLPFRFALVGGVGQVFSKDPSGVDLANHTRATRAGGETLHVPYTQPDNGDPTKERLRILHTDHVLTTSLPSTPPPPTVPPSAGADLVFKPDRGNVCVSFIDLGTGGTNHPSANYPAIVRDQTQMTGRYAFAAAFADIGDGNVVLQANNDFPVDPPAPVVSLGLETPSGSLGRLSAPNPPPPPITWTSTQDKRLDSGVWGDERCQFLLGTGSSTEQWVIGDRSITAVPSVGLYYYFGQHTYQANPNGIPTIELVGQWLLGRAQHRFGVDLHGYYRFLTSHPMLDAYTQPLAAGIAAGLSGLDPLGLVADTFVTAGRGGSPDGVLLIGRNTVLQYLTGQPSRDDLAYDFRGDPWEREVDITYGQQQPFSRSADWTFTLNSHPEWNNLEYPRRAVPQPNSSTLARSQQLFYNTPDPELTVTESAFLGRPASRSITPILEMVTTRTFLPKVTSLPSPYSGEPDSLILAAPCGYASCSPQLSLELATDLAVDPNDPFPTLPNPDWTNPKYQFLPIPPEYNATPPWVTQYRKGFVSLWQISGTPAFSTTDPDPLVGVQAVDPWSRARRATDPTPPNTWHLVERPPGSPDLDPLFLEGVGSSAFQIHFVDLVDDANLSRKFALVADFSGTVQAFDVTDLLLVCSGPRAPVAMGGVWNCPVDPLELRRPNVFDVVTDTTNDPGQVRVYIACTRMGVQVVTFDADAGFLAGNQHIVTPGSAHSVSIRVSAQERLLLISDLMAGHRFYRKP